MELADELAKKLGVAFEMVEYPTVEAILVALEKDEVDAAVAAISVTAEREQRVDFSHPFFVTGLGIAIRGGDRSPAASLVRGFLSREFLQLVGGVVVLLALVGVFFWLSERRSNRQYREGTPRKGIATGLGWSTILFFGHKGIFPSTVTGRFLAAACMLTSILLLSVLTGAIASILTVNQLDSPIRDENDLRYVRASAVLGTSSEAFLRRERIPFQSVEGPRAGLDALEAGQVDALVYDAPMMSYLILKEERGGLRVLDNTLESQDYAVALPLDSPWRKRINEALLDVRSSRRWSELLYRYVGQ